MTLTAQCSTVSGFFSATDRPTAAQTATAALGVQPDGFSTAAPNC